MKAVILEELDTKYRVCGYKTDPRLRRYGKTVSRVWECLPARTKGDAENLLAAQKFFLKHAEIYTLFRKDGVVEYIPLKELEVSRRRSKR